MPDWAMDWELDRIEDPDSEKREEQHRKHTEAMQKHVHTMMDMVSEAREMLREAKQAARDAETAAKRAEKISTDTHKAFEESAVKSKENMDGHGRIAGQAAGEAKSSSAAAGEAKKLAESSARSAAQAEKLAEKTKASLVAMKSYVDAAVAKADAKLSVLEERMKAQEELIKLLVSTPKEPGQTVVHADDGGKYGDLAKEIAEAITTAMARPRKIIRDRNGYAMGIE